MSKDRIVAKLKNFAEVDTNVGLTPLGKELEQRAIDSYVTRKKRRMGRAMERKHTQLLKTKQWLPIHLKDVSYEQSELKEAKENLSKVLSEADDFAREHG